MSLFPKFIYMHRSFMGGEFRGQATCEASRTAVDMALAREVFRTCGPCPTPNRSKEHL